MNRNGILVAVSLSAASLTMGGDSALAAEVNPLDSVVSSAKEKKFTGSPITLKLKDADVHEVMRMIGEASGFNVVVSPGVSGKVTVSLEEVPWDQALDVVMTTMNLAAERFESILRVMPREALMKEKQALIDAEKIAAQAAPRITRVFPVSYSDLTQLSTLLKGFLSNSASGGDAAASASSIQIDQNTQSLIVRDSVDAVERIKKMIALLDVQTPQVLIEAKVIDATDAFNKSIDGKLRLSAGGSSISINGGEGLAGSAGSAGGSAASTGSSNANAVKFGIGKSFSLNATLSYSESENRARVITSPRLMVLSGKTATILQGSNLSVDVLTVANGIQSVTRTFIPYNTSLDVTPRATNDGSVFMKLNLQRDVVITDANGVNTTAPRKVTTEVVVDSGDTLVLGGVQGTSETSASAGFPFLRKIPLIGWLFGSENETADKNELMFFVTPKIVNVRKAGLGNGGAPEVGEKPANL